MKIIVAGGRDFTNLAIMHNTLLNLGGCAAVILLIMLVL